MFQQKDASLGACAYPKMTWAYVYSTQEGSGTYHKSGAECNRMLIGMELILCVYAVSVYAISLQFPPSRHDVLVMLP
jgi:hypothetical protein